MTERVNLGIVAILVLTLLILLLGRTHQRLKLPTGSVTPAVSLGATHGLVLASDGSLWSWGSEYLGWPVLGLGSINHEASLLRIGNENAWVSISAGQFHNLAIKSDGTLWSWGENLCGQLGDGSTAPSQNKPVHSTSGTDWKQAAAGGYFSVALKKDGTLWAWGDNWAGQLGNGTVTRSRVPVQVGSSTNWAKVWAGMLQAAALQIDGTLWLWGDNPALATQLANSAKNLVVPTLLSPDTNWVEAAFCPDVLVALKSDGTLWACGRRAPIFTGTTNNPSPLTPVRLGSDSDWQSCSASEEARDLYVLLRKKDGSIWVMESSMAEGGLLHLKQIKLKGDLVALAGGGGGGHGDNYVHDGICTGIGLTRDGEVWTWGRALGYANSSLQAAAQIAQRLHYDAHWGDAKPINREQPWQLPNLESKQNSP
jgi:alpha-tubulin suppressor-like RCC1 family protein